jgi:hypothetical protein
MIELPSQQAQSRLQPVFRRFLGVFARPNIRDAVFLTIRNGSTQRRSTRPLR